MNTTIFPNIKQTTGGIDVPISKVMDGIKRGRWKAPIEKLRESGDKSIKTSLPYFTGSGTFSKRNDKGLKEHNDRIIIDIDNIPNLEDIRGLLSLDPYTEYLFISCSGNGLAVIVKIKGDKHKETFLSLQKYYMETYGIEVDKACKDLSRPRYISYDPHLFFNPTAKEYTDVEESKQIKIQEVKPKKVSSPAKRVLGYSHIIKSAVEMVLSAPDGDKHRVLLSAANLVGGYVAGGVLDEIECEGALVDAISQRNPRDLDGAIRTIIDGINNGKLRPLYIEDTKKDFKKLAKSQSVEDYARALNRAGNNWTNSDVIKCGEMFELDGSDIRVIFNNVFSKYRDEFNLDNKPMIVKVEHYLNSKYEFLSNEITQTTDFKKKEDKDFKLLNINDVYRDLQHSGFKFGLDRIKSLLNSDFVPSYNPFIEYFTNLKDYKKDEPDYIRQLAEHISTDNPEYFVEMFRKALVRCIACSLYNKENRIVFVLVGEKQGTGKSTFLRYLNPFGNKYYTESPLADNKDTEFRFSENFIYNLEELSSLSYVEINKLKAIISKSVVKERKAYAVNEIEQPRRCNFFGSTNRTDFLADIENTRWLCFAVLDINFSYTSINISNVWRQAWQLYRDGFNYQLTNEEANKRESINKDFEVVTSERELIIKNFRIVPENSGQFLSNTEILQDLVAISESKIRLTTYNVSRAMKQLGYAAGRKSVDGKQLRGYYVGRVSQMEKLTEDEWQTPF